jgi:hypothetical protein
MRSRAVKDVEEDAQRGGKIQTVAEYIISKGIWNPSRGDGSIRTISQASGIESYHIVNGVRKMWNASASGSTACKPPLCISPIDLLSS